MHAFFIVKDLTENWFSAILNAKNSFVGVLSHIFCIENTRETNP